MKDTERPEFSFKELDRLGSGIVKKAFRSGRQILICLLYTVAIFFVVNDFSLTVTSAEQFAAEKLPWLVLYVLAHYFCRDYGVQKGREDEEFQTVDKKYRLLCDSARGRRKEIEEYCRELERYYNETYRASALAELNVQTDETGAPVLDGVDAKTVRRVKRILKRKPVRITYRMLVDRAEKGGRASASRPIKPSFESYMRKSSCFSVAKIVLLSFFTFSLTASFGDDPWSNFLNGIPYLVTMVSVSITAILGAYRSVLTYDIDCLNDRIAVLGKMETDDRSDQA